MSKSLEYINYQIITLEDSLQHYTMVEPDKIKEVYIKHDLECLYQIKSELEAWEEMKKYIILEKGLLVRYDVTYEYIELKNGCIDESNSPEEGKSLTVIKKALEVENDK